MTTGSGATNVVWHAHNVTQDERATQKQQKPCVIWLTGLSGSGKSTIANALDGELYRRGHHSYLLDGDNIRFGLNKDLGFSDADRIENIRRIGEVAKLFADSGLIVITAFISPFRSDRTMVRRLLPAGSFYEVHAHASLEICESRDPKGLYKKARAGQIPNFTGIDSPYEAPDAAELVINTGELDVQTATDQLIAMLVARGQISG